MFHTLITADLPSREVPGAAPGDDAFAPTHDEVTYGSAHLLELIRRAASNAGVLDLAWIDVDGRVVYADHAGDEVDEVDKLLERAASAGFLGRAFHRMVLVLVHNADDIRHVCEVVVHTQVPAGEPELSVHVASRPMAWSPPPGTLAAPYVNSLHAAASQDVTVRTFREAVQTFCARFVASLRSALHESEVACGETRMVIVRPGEDALRSLSALRFGRETLQVRYDIAPEGRWPRWPDPFLRLFDDPYLVLRHLTFLDALMEEGHLRHGWVDVTSGDGRVLFTGQGAAAFEASPWRKRFSLAYDAQGVHVTFAQPASPSPT